MIQRFFTCWLLALLTAVVGCSSSKDPGDGDGHGDPSDRTGSISLSLQLTDDVFLDEVDWVIVGPEDFERSGTLDLSSSNTLTGRISDIPFGSGYTISLDATDREGTATCQASEDFDILSAEETTITVTLRCKLPGHRQGTLIVNGEINVCPLIDTVTAPLVEINLGAPLALSSTGHDPDQGPQALSYSWSATSGTFSDPDSAQSTFTCTELGAVTVTLSLSDGDICPDERSFGILCSQPPGGSTMLSVEGPQSLQVGEAGSLTISTDDGFSGERLVSVGLEGHDLVQDGLMIHWDGVQNTRAGRDTTSTVWEDLSGHGIDLDVALSDENRWVEDGFALSETQFPVPQALVDLVNGDAFTFEMVLDEYQLTGTSFGTILSSANDNFSYFHRVSNGVLEFKNSSNARPKAADAASIFQGSTGAIAFEKGALSTLYVDGATQETFTPSVNIGANEMWLGHAHDSRKWSGVIESVRLYDHALSAEQIAYNSTIDQQGRARPLGSPASLDGQPFTQGLVELSVSFENGEASLPLRFEQKGEFTLTVQLGEQSAALPIQVESTALSHLDLALDGDNKLVSGTPEDLQLSTDTGFSGQKAVSFALSSGYVAEGLMIHWDGGQNTRAGRDDTSTVWEDLSGHGIDLDVALSDENHWVEDGFAISETQFPVPQALVDLVNGDAFTFEMVLDEYQLTGTSFGTILSSANDNFSYFHRVSNGVLEFKNSSNARPTAADATSIFQGSTGAITFEKGALSTLYVNGSGQGTFTPSVNIGANEMWLGHAHDSRKWSGVIRSVRLYDRALSAEEIAHNASLDQQGPSAVQGVSGSLGGVDFVNDQAQIIVTFQDGQASLPLVLSGEGPVTLTAEVDDITASLPLELENPAELALMQLSDLEATVSAEMTQEEKNQAVKDAAQAKLDAAGVQVDSLSVTHVSENTYRFSLTIGGNTQEAEYPVLLLTGLDKIWEAVDLLELGFFPVDQELSEPARLATVLERAEQLLKDTRFSTSGGQLAVVATDDAFAVTLSLLGDSQSVTVTPNRTVWTEDFEGTANGSLPEGWTYAGNAAEVQDGKLLTTGGRHDQIAGPFALDPEAPADFVYEADIRFVQVDEPSRWGALMFGYHDGTWYQNIARQNATAGNGTEFAHWNGSGWSVIQTTPYSEALDPEKSYRFKSVFSKGAVTHYIDDTLLTTTSVSIEEGRFGFSSSGVRMELDNIRVTLTPLTVPLTDFNAELYEPVTGLPVPPTVVLEAGQNVSDVFAADKRPATVLVVPDQDLNVYATDGTLLSTSLDDYLSDAYPSTIPAFYLGDLTTANALGSYLEENGVRDAFVAATAENAELVETIAQSSNTVSGVIYFPSLPADADEAALWDVVTTTNSHHAKIAVIPAEAATKENVLYLQRRLITVWVRLDEESAALGPQIYQQLTGGVDGLVTADYLPVLDAIESFSETTLLRQSQITGHRGMPSRFIENTLRSAIGAYEAGADSIENDVYITADGVVVVNHDSTTGRMHTENLSVENSTWDQLAALTFKSDAALPGERMSTLEDYFVEFKGKDVVHFIEIKSGKPEIVAAIRDLARLHDVEEQCVVITFNGNIVQQMRADWPEVSTGFLGGFGDAGSAPANVQNIIARTHPENTTFNPSFSTSDAYAQAVYDTKHRGVTFWTWTVNGDAALNAARMTGVQGITTDDAWRVEDLPYTILVDDLSTSARNDAHPSAAFSLTTRTLTRIGQEVADPAYELIQISGPVIESDGSSYYAQEAGTAHAMLRTLVSPNGGTPYFIYSSPFIIELTE